MSLDETLHRTFLSSESRWQTCRGKKVDSAFDCANTRSLSAQILIKTVALSQILNKARFDARRYVNNERPWRRGQCNLSKHPEQLATRHSVTFQTMGISMFMNFCTNAVSHFSKIPYAIFEFHMMTESGYSQAKRCVFATCEFAENDRKYLRPCVMNTWFVKFATER